MTPDVQANGGGRRGLMRGGLAAAIILVALAAVAARVEDAVARPTNGWTRTFALRLSAQELGLPDSSPARRLARAALSRSAGRLGLPRSLAGVALKHDLRVPPGPARGLALHNLRFQQTSGGRRVLWSQIEVLVAGREATSITATVVPVKPGRPAAGAQISRRRALAIAHRAVAGLRRRSPHSR